MEDFNEFKRLVEDAGMIARRCTQYHWQIQGGAVQVNWWPSTGRMAAKGSTGRSLQGSVAKAIELAKSGEHPSLPSMIGGVTVPLQITKRNQFDLNTRRLAWIALICGAISLSITIGRFICEIW